MRLRRVIETALTSTSVAAVVALSATLLATPAAAASPGTLTAQSASVRTMAMQKALSKVGAKYRWGASGPNAFDCSGLVTWAYRTSGKSLPRSSKDMSRVGTPVSKGDLQPGDLVFFYSGPSHVGIYIGNGQIVHASNPRHPVKTADMGSMPFNTARRI
jgi:cell wall-associated NlpC family hydrolase